MNYVSSSRYEYFYNWYKKQTTAELDAFVVWITLDCVCGVLQNINGFYWGTKVAR